MHWHANVTPRVPIQTGQRYALLTATVALAVSLAVAGASSSHAQDEPSGSSASSPEIARQLTAVAEVEVQPSREVAAAEADRSLAVRLQRLLEFYDHWQRTAEESVDQAAAQVVPAADPATGIAPLPDAPGGELTREREQEAGQ